VQDRGILGPVRFIKASLEVWKERRKEGGGLAFP